MTKSPYKYIVIAGSTASGKSFLALNLAEKLQGEIVNCDSIQVYKGFDIGSAKPSSEDLERVPHHLYSIAEPSQDFDAVTYARQARACISNIIGRGKIPIVVGGTGLYLRTLWGQNFHGLPTDPSLRQELQVLDSSALMDELKVSDPIRAQAIHPNDRFRLVRAVELCRLLGRPVTGLEDSSDCSHEAFKIRVSIDRQSLHARIRRRVLAMLESGLVEEVVKLLESGTIEDTKPMKSIGYKQTLDYIHGRIGRQELEDAIVIATRQYAKRQETWFRKVPFDLKVQNP